MVAHGSASVDPGVRLRQPVTKRRVRDDSGLASEVRWRRSTTHSGRPRGSRRTASGSSSPRTTRRPRPRPTPATRRSSPTASILRSGSRSSARSRRTAKGGRAHTNRSWGNNRSGPPADDKGFTQYQTWAGGAAGTAALPRPLRRQHGQEERQDRHRPDHAVRLGAGQGPQRPEQPTARPSPKRSPAGPPSTRRRRRSRCTGSSWSAGRSTRVVTRSRPSACRSGRMASPTGAIASRSGRTRAAPTSASS
jgi:hypothetical protein